MRCMSYCVHCLLLSWHFIGVTCASVTSLKGQYLQDTANFLPSIVAVRSNIGMHGTAKFSGCVISHFRWTLKRSYNSHLVSQNCMFSIKRNWELSKERLDAFPEAKNHFSVTLLQRPSGGWPKDRSTGVWWAEKRSPPNLLGAGNSSLVSWVLVLVFLGRKAWDPGVLKLFWRAPKWTNLGWEISLLPSTLI